MEAKEKKMIMLFGMFFIAALIITLTFNSGEVTGEAVKQFNSAKEKSNYCEMFCDTELSKTNPAYSSWTECHEECMNN